MFGRFVRIYYMHHCREKLKPWCVWCHPWVNGGTSTMLLVLLHACRESNHRAGSTHGYIPVPLGSGMRWGLIPLRTQTASVTRRTPLGGAVMLFTKEISCC